MIAARAVGPRSAHMSGPATGRRRGPWARHDRPAAVLYMVLVQGPMDVLAFTAGALVTGGVIIGVGMRLCLAPWRTVPTLSVHTPAPAGVCDGDRPVQPVSTRFGRLQ